MAILTAADYPAIRAALDVELDAEALPDDMINMSIYRAAADQDVIDLDPLAESRTDGTEVARVKRAAIYFCAARLAPVVPRIQRMTMGGDTSFERSVFDPQQRAGELRAMARDEIDEILTPAEDAPRKPTFFSKASGRRGR